MGGTDTGKQDIADKPKPPLPPITTPPLIEDGASESLSIPQMIVTSADGLSEDLTENETGDLSSSQSVLQRPLALGSGSSLSESLTETKQEDSREADDLHSVIQRPLVINPEYAPLDDETKNEAKTPIVQRPLLLVSVPGATEGEVQQVKKEIEDLQSVVQRPLVITSVPGSIEVGVQQDKDSDLQSVVQRPLLVGSGLSSVIEKEETQQDKREAEDSQSAVQRPLVVSFLPVISEEQQNKKEIDELQSVIQRPLLVSSGSEIEEQQNKKEADDSPPIVQQPFVVSSSLTPSPVLAEDEIAEHDKKEAEELTVQKNLIINSEDIDSSTTDHLYQPVEAVSNKTVGETETKSELNRNKQEADQSSHSPHDDSNQTSPEHVELPSDKTHSPEATSKSRVFAWVTDGKSVFNLCKHDRSTKTQKKDSEPTDSSDEACCSRLAVLLRNKAVELVSSHTLHKPLPPPKPPKPSAEVIAKARAARLEAQRPKSFGDDIPIGIDGMRYVDDETESSTDYKDVEDNMAFVVESPYFEAYDMLQSGASKKVQTLTDHSVVSEDSSYHTADTVTLKDEGNISDNTLDSISLGSDDSWVAKPLSFTPSNKESHFPPSSIPDNKSIPTKNKVESSVALTKHTNDNIQFSFASTNEKGPNKTSHKGIIKRERPPIPPKPAILLKSLKKDDAACSSRLSRLENSQHLKGLSLSPRPQHREFENAKQRPLRVSSIKRTVFPDHLRTKNIQHKVGSRPLSVTLEKDVNIRTPSESSVPLDKKSSASETQISPPLSPSQKIPPARPPPPDFTKIKDSKPQLCDNLPSPVESTAATTPVFEDSIAPVLLTPEDIPVPPPAPPPKPIRIAPLNNSLHPTLGDKPPRPPPPAPRPRSKTVPITGVPAPKIVEESPVIVESTPLSECLTSTSTPDLSEPSLHADSPASVIYVDKTSVLSDDIAGTSSVVSHTVLSLNDRLSDSIDQVCHAEPSLPIDTSVRIESITTCPEKSEVTEVCVTHSDMPIKDNLTSYLPICNTSITSVLDDFKESAEEPLPPPRSLHKRPKPPPRVRRNRSRTVEIVCVTTRPEVPKRRSRSFTESDVRKRLEAHNLTSLEKPEMKFLYTSVQKEHSKNKIKDDEIVEDAKPGSKRTKSRPLPAPPPPPRSRSKSGSRSRASGEKHVGNFTDLCEKVDNDEKNKEKKEERTQSPINDIQIKMKCENETLTEGNCQMANDISDIISEKNEPSSILKEIEPCIDENANIAEQLPSTTIQQDLGERRLSQSIFYCDDINITESKKKSPSPSHSQRSKSASPGRKSHASWYDESDVSGDLADVESSVSSQKASYEKLNALPDSELKEVAGSSPSQQKSKQVKNKAESSRKQARSSKFYCDADGQLPTVYNIENNVDIQDVKEPSPVLLERVEKSVQTSLETLGHETVSRDEQSDDTDELLSIAQNLQKELKVILQRHRTAGDETSEEDNPAERKDRNIDFTPDSSYIGCVPVLDKRGEAKSFMSNRSSISEASLQSSSEESEEESLDHSSLTPEEAVEWKKKKKAYYVAREIMSSEEVFVDALRLINQDFKTAVGNANEQGSSVVPDEILNQILRHHPQLQNLNEKLLEELKERVQNWENVPKIADVIVKIGPFLKLYSWYIKDYETMTTALDEACKKYPLFAQAVKEFEMSPRCQKLQIAHYLLKPVQRIPQYRLLLQEYFHNLSKDSPDYQDTLTALEIVSKVADHANEAMREGDNFQKLLSIQNSIAGNKEIIQPGRIFLKEGELMKLSRKGMQPRWFVLLSDLLLYMTPMQQGMFRMNHELPLTGMRVDIPVQEDYQNEFSVISTTRSFSLAARSPEERSEWIKTLTKAIKENANKRSTFTNIRIHQDGIETSSSESFILGKQAPVWIPDSRVTMCQLCTTEFTVTFRRHHCRACGKVVCSQCSANKAPLQYRQYKVERVCDECFMKLMKELDIEGRTLEEAESGTGGTETGDTDSDTFQKVPLKSQFKGNSKSGAKKIKRYVPKVLKEVCANDQGSTISGYLQKRGRHKGWKRYWFVIKDKVLYTYKASEDIVALESIPLLGFKVETLTEAFEGFEPPLLFRLTHAGRPPITFHTETSSSAEKWFLAMQDATVLE